MPIRGVVIPVRRYVRLATVVAIVAVGVGVTWRVARRDPAVNERLVVFGAEAARSLPYGELGSSYGLTNQAGASLTSLTRPLCGDRPLVDLSSLDQVAAADYRGTINATFVVGIDPQLSDPLTYLGGPCDLERGSVTEPVSTGAGGALVRLRVDDESIVSVNRVDDRLVVMWAYGGSGGIDEAERLRLLDVALVKAANPRAAPTWLAAAMFGFAAALAVVAPLGGGGLAALSVFAFASEALPGYRWYLVIVGLLLVVGGLRSTALLASAAVGTGMLLMMAGVGLGGPAPLAVTVLALTWLTARHALLRALNPTVQPGPDTPSFPKGELLESLGFTPAGGLAIGRLLFPLYLERGGTIVAIGEVVSGQVEFSSYFEHRVLDTTPPSLTRSFPEWMLVQSLQLPEAEAIAVHRTALACLASRGSPDTLTVQEVPERAAAYTRALFTYRRRRAWLDGPIVLSRLVLRRRVSVPALGDDAETTRRTEQWLSAPAPPAELSPPRSRFLRPQPANQDSQLLTGRSTTRRPR